MKALALAPAACLLAFLSAGAPAQMVSPKAAPEATCAECGVVRSVRRVETKPAITAEERKSTSGLVASVPLGGGQPSVGSSTDVRREQKPAVVTFEVVVRLDDGRFQVVLQDEAGSLREGDKVKVERGKVLLRAK